jgi:acyl-ACP thioesterase
VRLGDVAASGRIRLDAIARYLQDVAFDDGKEVGVGGTWVLRRSTLRFGHLPRYRDEVEMTTFCSGSGPRWVERRTTLRVDGQVAVEAAAIWVSVDDAGRPTTLEPWFGSVYGEAAVTRRVSGRLRLPAPPSDARTRPWPLRASDLDVLGHVNNALAGAAIEDGLSDVGAGEALAAATIEYRAAIDPGEVPDLVVSTAPGRVACWLCCGDDVRVAATVAVADA